MKPLFIIVYLFALVSLTSCGTANSGSPSSSLFHMDSNDVSLSDIEYLKMSQEEYHVNNYIEKIVNLATVKPTTKFRFKTPTMYLEGSLETFTYLNVPTIDMYIYNGALSTHLIKRQLRRNLGVSKFYKFKNKEIFFSGNKIVTIDIQQHTTKLSIVDKATVKESMKIKPTL